MGYHVKKHSRRTPFFLGFICGIATCGLLVYYSVPKLMVITSKSSLDYKDTIKTLESAVTENGWSFRGTENITEELKSRIDTDLTASINTISMCKAVYASTILSDSESRFSAVFMPCKLAVWEDDDNSVYVSYLNAKLMGRLMGGTLYEVLGKEASSDIDSIVSAVKK
ncbi:MAG: DUF302 domain-containing protein [Candidatus Auribacterota bacterium]